MKLKEVYFAEIEEEYVTLKYNYTLMRYIRKINKYILNYKKYYKDNPEKYLINHINQILNKDYKYDFVKLSDKDKHLILTKFVNDLRNNLDT